MSEELPPNERPPEPPPSETPPPRPPAYYGGEKEQEKEEEKYQEKEVEKVGEKEQAYTEKYRSDPISATFWAGILILAGVIFLAWNFDLLPQYAGMEVWNWVALGAGGLLALEVLVRLVSPDHARPITGRIIFAAILIVVGLSGIVDTDIVWPIAIIAVGLAILFGGFLRRR